MNINNKSGPELVGLSSSIAILLSTELNSEELAILSVFLTSLADNLALISATKALDKQ